jgi:hypothetical protein
MSSLIRAMKGQAPNERLQDLIAAITGQRSNLPEELGPPEIEDEAMDYLKGPSMASLLMKNAKAMTLRNQLEEAQMAGMDPEAAARKRAQNEAEMNIYPMIASIKQLDR